MVCSHCSLLVTALLLFSSAELAFGLAIAAACSRAKIAAIMAPILHLASLMPRYIFFRTGEHTVLSCGVVRVGSQAAPSLVPDPPTCDGAHMVSHCGNLCATGEPQAIGGKYAVSLLAPTAFTFFADLLAQVWTCLLLQRRA